MKVFRQKNYPCEVCDQTFSHSGLITHKKIHSMKHFECRECSKVYTSRINLIVHQKEKHNPFLKDLSFECSLCESSFTQKSSLSKHVKTLHGNRPSSNKPNVQFSEDEVIEMVKSGNLADRQILSVLQDLRKQFGKNIITANIKEKLRNRKRIMDEFMTSEDVEFTSKDGDFFKTGFVYCKHIEGLVNFICDWRATPKEDCKTVVGIDNGKGKLIMTLNCVKKDKERKGTFRSTGAVPERL